MFNRTRLLWLMLTFTLVVILSQPLNQKPLPAARSQTGVRNILTA